MSGPITGPPNVDYLRILKGKIEVARSGRGVLCRFSKVFLDAMADANELRKRPRAEDKARGDDEFTLAEAKASEYDKAWLAAGDWPKSVASTRNRLTRLGPTSPETTDKNSTAGSALRLLR